MVGLRVYLLLLVGLELRPGRHGRRIRDQVVQRAASDLGDVVDGVLLAHRIVSARLSWTRRLLLVR